MRDTDRDWSVIADTHPYYGVLTNERYLNPGADDLADFFSTGEGDISYMHAVIERVLGPFAPRSALDFGCGVGRLLLPLARIAGTATGVDIADGMLKLARTHAENAGVQAELVKEIPADVAFDWVNTSIVLQHIPPARGYGLIRRLWAAVAKDGVLSLQITIFKDARHMGELQRDLAAFRFDGETLVNYTAEDDETIGISMYDYDLSRVFQILDLQDGQPVYMEKTDHGGCHGFRIYVRKR